MQNGDNLNVHYGGNSTIGLTDHAVTEISADNFQFDRADADFG